MSYQKRIFLGKDIRGVALSAYTMVGGRRVSIGYDIIDAKTGEIVLTFQSKGVHNYNISSISGKPLGSGQSILTTESTPVQVTRQVSETQIMEGIKVTIGAEPLSPKIGDYWGVPL